MRTVAFNWAMVRHGWRAFSVHSLFHILHLALPVGLGLVEQAFFDRLTGAKPAGPGVWTLVALFVAIGLAEIGCLFPDVWGGVTFRRSVGAWLRGNLLAAQLRRPGALPLPLPVGEAISRYRDDVAEVADFPTWVPHVVGYLVAFAVAIAIMLRINATITLIVMLPLIGMALLTKVAWARLVASWDAARDAADAATGHLGEIFGAADAIQLAGAEPAAVARYATISWTRAQAAVRTRMIGEVLNSVGQLLAPLATAVVLLIGGRAIGSGSFTVGDFALFVTYLPLVTSVPALLGTFAGDAARQHISLRRQIELIPDEPPAALVASPSTAVGTVTTTTQRPAGAQRAGDRLAATTLLRAVDAGYSYPSSGRGVRGVSLAIQPGTLTLISGPIGGGKTTLLRVLLGLLPSEGRVVLNVRAGYVPQVPRLFSATLRANLLLGADDAALAAALALAQLEPDIAQLENGLETFVGPRGLRLSGGQAQRAAAARALVRRPQLLVLDDLSSALDVETEQRLWAGLDRWRRAEPDRAVIAVSHRQAARRYADTLITVADGAVIEQGLPDVVAQM